MASRSEIVKLFTDQPIGTDVTVKGWVRTFRNDQFITVTDGSTIRTLQVVVKKENFDDATLKRIQTGTWISAFGKIEKSLGNGQDIELICESMEILGDCDPNEFPIQMKRERKTV